MALDVYPKPELREFRFNRRNLHLRSAATSLALLRRTHHTSPAGGSDKSTANLSSSMNEADSRGSAPSLTSDMLFGRSGMPCRDMQSVDSARDSDVASKIFRRSAVCVGRVGVVAGASVICILRCVYVEGSCRKKTIFRHVSFSSPFAFDEALSACNWPSRLKSLADSQALLLFHQFGKAHVLFAGIPARKDCST